MATNARARLDQLEDVCAEFYQVLGALGAPARVLNQALAAAEGRDLPYDTLLPFSRTEAATGGATTLGRRGGSVKSDAKASAAIANGKRGGRPVTDTNVHVAHVVVNGVKGWMVTRRGREVFGTRRFRDAKKRGQEIAEKEGVALVVKRD